MRLRNLQTEAEDHVELARGDGPVRSGRPPWDAYWREVIAIGADPAAINAAHRKFWPGLRVDYPISAPKCDECNAVGPVVQLGEPLDYESRTASICRECLQKALTVLG